MNVLPHRTRVVDKVPVLKSGEVQKRRVDRIDLEVAREGLTRGNNTTLHVAIKSVVRRQDATDIVSATAHAPVLPFAATVTMQVAARYPYGARTTHFCRPNTTRGCALPRRSTMRRSYRESPTATWARSASKCCAACFACAAARTGGLIRPISGSRTRYTDRVAPSLRRSID